MRITSHTPLLGTPSTGQGLTGSGGWAAQWYLRQAYWLDAARVPELSLPADHFLSPATKGDETKVIPDGIEDFTRSALEHIAGLPREVKSSGEIRAITEQLQQQKKRLQQVKEGLASEAAEQGRARKAGLAAAGPDVLPLHS